MSDHNYPSFVYFGISSRFFEDEMLQSESEPRRVSHVIDEHDEFDRRLLRLAEKVGSRRSSPRHYKENSRSIWEVRKPHRPLPKLNGKPSASTPSSKPKGTAPFHSNPKSCHENKEKVAFVANQTEPEHDWEEMTASTAPLTPPTSPERTSVVPTSSSPHQEMLDGDCRDAGTKPLSVRQKEAAPSTSSERSHRSCASQEENRQRVDPKDKETQHNIDYFFSILSDEPFTSGKSQSRGSSVNLYTHIPVSSRRRKNGSSGAPSELYAYSELAAENTSSSSSRRRSSIWSSLATVLGYKGVDEQSSSCPSRVERNVIAKKRDPSEKKRKNHSLADDSWYLVTSDTPILQDNPLQHTMVMIWFDSEEQATSIITQDARGSEIFDTIEEECEDHDSTQQGQEDGDSQERENHDDDLDTSFAVSQIGKRQPPSSASSF